MLPPADNRKQTELGSFFFFLWGKRVESPRNAHRYSYYGSGQTFSILAKKEGGLERGKGVGGETNPDPGLSLVNGLVAPSKVGQKG